MQSTYTRVYTVLLNPDKSKAAFFGTNPGLRKPGLPSSISVAGCPIAVLERLKILGVMLDSSLSFDDHVNAVVQACNYHIRSLRYIRHSVTRDIMNTLACSIAGSRIDYCNALLYGVSGKNINRLQRLQNGLARVVCDIGV